MKRSYLFIVFVLLLAVYLIFFVFNKKSETSFDDNLVDIDKDLVDVIKIKNNGEMSQTFSLEKSTDDQWYILGDKKYKADDKVVESTLSAIEKIKIKNIVTRNPEKLGQYELEENKAKRVELYSNNKLLVDILIGKFNFNQQARTANSFVRLTGKNDVYATDGFNGFMVNGEMDNYRIKTIANFDANSITGINLQNESLNYEFIKIGNDWSVNGSVLDSVKMKSYLNYLSSARGNKFVTTKPDFDQFPLVNSLKIRENDNQQVNINAYKNEQENKFIIHSDQNEDAYFESDSSGIYKKLFIDLIDMISYKEE